MKNTLLKKFKKFPSKLRVIITAAAVLTVLLICLICDNFIPTTIKGIDISHYQNKINWNTLKSGQDAGFVYIKATEGKTYKDPTFKSNWESASQYEISAGAYHYFSASSAGADQAKNFISEVPKESGKLPPAVDIEIKSSEISGCKTELANFVSKITAYYGQKPVFYVPYDIYALLHNDYSGFNFWITDYKNSSPKIHDWTFFQYSEKGSVPGISGKVDLDRFRGSLWDFHSLFSN